jgi:hypothetical protein
LQTDRCKPERTVSHDHKDRVSWNLVECERDRSTTPEGWELFVEPVREMVLDRPEDEHLVLLFHGDLTSQ